MSNYAELLRSLVPDFYWFRNAHWKSEGKLGLIGTVLLGDGVGREDIVVLLDDKPVNFEVRDSTYGADKFWFMPEASRFDVFVQSHDIGDDRPFTVSIKLQDEVEPAVNHTFVQVADWKGIALTPPVSAIERVSGKGATGYNYHSNGLTDAWRFGRIAARHGLDLSKADVLDWGCGCGRLSRHLIRKARSLHGIDIDGENVEWCKQNLDPTRFEVVDLYPPTRYADESFDLVIANSVLSHLTLDAMQRWLEEVRRILRPEGIALLSYHGEFSLAGFCSKSEERVRGVLESGFNADTIAGEVNDVISDPEYYRHTFMTDQFAKTVFSRYFSVEDQIVGVVSRFQNVGVLRKI